MDHHDQNDEADNKLDRSRNNDTEDRGSKEDHLFSKGGNEEINRATRFRKGACENCGAITHVTKFCCERPRKVGAKYKGKIADDEIIIKSDGATYDEKRDRFKHFVDFSFKARMEEFNKSEEIRTKRKEDGVIENVIAKNILTGLKDDEINKKPAGPNDKKQYLNDLRLRDDKAKYIYNLDENSASYNAKSHSMNENPNPGGDSSSFQGDQKDKFTGDSLTLLEQEKFQIEPKKKGEVHLCNFSMPSQAELMFKKYKETKSDIVRTLKKNLVEKYGGEEYLNPPKIFIDQENETYSEYTITGKPVPIQNQSKKKKSRYEEDIFLNDHKSVWGSYFHEHFGWGYACCYSHDRNSFCSFEEGKKLQIIRESAWELEQKQLEEVKHLKQENK